MILCKRGVRQEDQLGRVPRPAGRPARARDRRQGGRAAGSPRTELFRERQRRTVEGAQAVADELLERRPRRERADRRDRRAPRARRPARVRARRPAGRGPAARDRDHRQPQRRAVRSAAAGGLVRAARRHPALATRGLQADDFGRSARIIARALQPGFEGVRDDLAERVAAIAERYPLYAQMPGPSAAAVWAPDGADRLSAEGDHGRPRCAAWIWPRRRVNARERADSRGRRRGRRAARRDWIACQQHVAEHEPEALRA